MEKHIYIYISDWELIIWLKIWGELIVWKLIAIERTVEGGVNFLGKQGNRCSWPNFFFKS